MQIHERLVRVKERIADACQRVGRTPAGVLICAVSKTQPLAMVEAAYSAGLYTFGENYVQEAIPKFANLPDAALHLIGHLQSNKVKQALQRVNLVETLDSGHLAAAVEKEAARQARIVPIYIEVNVAGEASKSGVSIEQAAELASYVAENAPHLRIEGLMTVAPAGAGEVQLHRVFASLRELGAQMRRQLDKDLHPCWELSMGMSDDYEIAIAEGATLIRLGRAIFGERA
jgi:pyridoxal phosphate enzyme (YggS family)